MTNEEAKAFLDNLKILVSEHPVVADWLVEIADRKTEPTGYNLSPVEDEPTISKMEQVDEDINVRSKDCTTCKHAGEVYEDPCELCYRHSHYEPKDEPQTDCGDFADRLAYERGVKHAWEVAQKVFDSTLTFYEAEDLAKQIDKDINVRSKDEPQTDCAWKRG